MKRPSARLIIWFLVALMMAIILVVIVDVTNDSFDEACTQQGYYRVGDSCLSPSDLERQTLTVEPSRGPSPSPDSN